MKTEDTKNWDDLVFENRNQAYGAYVIRKAYNRNVSEAVLASVLFAGLALFLLNFANGVDKPFEKIIPVIGPVYPPKLDEQIKPATHQKGGPKTPNQNLTPVAVPDSVEERHAEISQDVPGPVGLENGDEVSFGVDSVEVDEGIEIAPPPTVDFAEQMPEFNGGMRALIQFVSERVKYPSAAKRMGIEGQVFVQFVVDYSGKVVDVKVVRGISQDCDKEAARVIALLPQWKPGQQNKMPVSVRMIVPIKFRIVD